MSKYTIRRMLVKSVLWSLLLAGCGVRLQKTLAPPKQDEESNIVSTLTVQPSIGTIASTPEVYDSTPPPTALESADTTLPVHVTSPIAMIAAGFNHGLALTEAGNVWGWGRGTSLGLDNERVVFPFQLDIQPVRYISAGVNESICVLQDGGIILLQEGSTIFLETKDIGEIVKAVPYSTGVTIALGADGRTWFRAKEGLEILPFEGRIVGNGQFSQLDITDVTDIEAEGASVFLQRADGSLWVWGQAGLTVTDNIFYKPQLYQDFEALLDVTRWAGIVAVVDDGQVWQQGPKYNNELIPGLENIVSVAGDLSTAEVYAVDINGSVWGWGSLPKRVYEDAPEFNEYILDPVRINMPEPIKQISHNSGHILALDVQGTVWTWNAGLVRPPNNSPANSEMTLPVALFVS